MVALKLTHDLCNCGLDAGHGKVRLEAERMLSLVLDCIFRNDVFKLDYSRARFIDSFDVQYDLF